MHMMKSSNNKNNYTSREEEGNAERNGTKWETGNCME